MADGTKYGGSVTILDDEGNVVFERELDADEIIGELLSALPDATEPEPDEDSPEGQKEEEPSDGYSFVKHTSPRKERRASKGCPSCGSPSRHKKNCALKKPSQPVENEDDEADERRPYKGAANGPELTRDQWEGVKDCAENDLHFSAVGYASQYDLDLKEVNRAILTKSYEAYLASYRLSS